MALKRPIILVRPDTSVYIVEPLFYESEENFFPALFTGKDGHPFPDQRMFSALNYDDGMHPTEDVYLTTTLKRVFEAFSKKWSVLLWTGADHWVRSLGL